VNPPATPETIPLELPTAAAVLLLDHVPVPEASLNVVAGFAASVTHIIAGATIAAGNGLTVIVDVLIQVFDPV
jgi:hypothetical protein